MECIAHRGFAGVNPENTLAAVRDAVGRVGAVEVDVRRCGSGDLVVCHDATVDRVTGSTGRIAELGAGDLAALSVEGSGEGIPTLAAVLRTFPDEATLHAELKERDASAETVELASGAETSVVVSSFHEDVLREVANVRASSERPPTALLTAELGDRDVLDRARDLDCRAVHAPTGETTPRFVDRAHRAGLAVNVWTVTDPAETRRALVAGVDGVITDFPACCPSAVGESPVGQNGR